MNKAKLYALAMLTAGTTIAEAQNTPVSQMEKLTRGVVVVPAASGSGQFISWRLLGTDNDATTFDILKDGKLLKTDIFDKTNFVDKTGYTNSNYQIVTKQNGVATDTTAAVTSWGNIYMQLPLDRPEGGVTPAKETYTYSPNDCSAGDVDGDGEYEIIVKWDPSNSKDNSQSGYTGNVYLDCYKLDGTKLWRIDLGKNIRAGAHYTQFMVYDFDGDGKAEMMCKTAPGSIDGAGQYVSEAADDETIKKVNNTYDWRNTSGKVKGGQEYLTVFDGYTGKPYTLCSTVRTARPKAMLRHNGAEKRNGHSTGTTAAEKPTPNMETAANAIWPGWHILTVLTKIRAEYSAADTTHGHISGR